MASPDTSWKFVHVTDIHIGSPKSYRFKPGWNDNWTTATRQIQALGPELLLVGGDLARDGNTEPDQFDLSRAAIDAVGVPWHVIPGNMDTGNKITDRQGARTDRDDVACNVTEELLQTFRSRVGPFPWTFTHRDVRFSGCYEIIKDTSLPSARELDRFLSELESLPPSRHHVMLNHYPLFVDEINEPAYDLTQPDDYLGWYFGVDPEPRRRLLASYHRAGVTHVLSGHIHCRRPPMTIDGITFCFGASTAMPQFGDRWSDGDDTLGFQAFTVTPTGIEYQFHPLSVVSQRTDGWGPGGHPKPEARQK
ncbi:MAG: metallophosphoesterase [Cephaloticoccus sp.]|nr:metallophosphoesterase [Cephaloticoccus sp.]